MSLEFGNLTIDWVNSNPGMSVYKTAIVSGGEVVFDTSDAGFTLAIRGASPVAIKNASYPSEFPRFKESAIASDLSSITFDTDASDGTVVKALILGY